MPKKKTTSEFISDAIKVHGDVYNYDKVVYIDSKTKVTLVCDKHGDFNISPNLHISKKGGCQKCAVYNRVEKSKVTKEEFINRCYIKHKDKYTYPDINFNSVKDTISIVCSKHGIFNQKVIEHLSGKGCRKCYYDSNKLDYDEFVRKSNIVNNGSFLYDKFVYTDSKTESIIRCHNNHEFKRTPNRHLSKLDRCPVCKENEYIKDNLEKINFDGFDYVKWKGEIVTIKCVKCSGVFDRKISSHIKLKNCIYCSPNKLTESIFLEKSKRIHGERYDYSKVKYIDTRSKVKLICNQGHEIEQKVNNHLNGTGCPKCNRFNIKESQVYKFISENYKGEIIRYDRTILNGKELDILLPEIGIAFEFNGLYWHSEIYKYRNYHSDKTNECNKSGIQLIHIWEDDWDNKQEIVKSIILNKINFSKRIFARNCFLDTPSNREVCNFLKQNHIQGFVGSKVKLGLYYNNELVSIMTFGSLRKSLGQNNKENSYELLRFCNKLNTTVVGGASKLLKHFINNFSVSEIVSYSDNSRGVGNLYKKLGFEYNTSSRPGYYYIIDGCRKHRFNYRKDKLVKEGADIKMTEIEIMHDKGYYRIFDCGSNKWTLSVKHS